MKNYITIKGLSKIYTPPGLLAKREKITAVDNVDLNIPAGKTFGLVGESGCGKTTLSRCVLYLDPPTQGEVIMDGTDLSGLPARELRQMRRKMQIVFQDPNSALNPKMRIKDSIMEGLENIQYPPKEREDRIADLLEVVGISPDHRNRFPHEFSGGQKQRIVIARALAINPDFLILDEPVSNLDVSIQAQIINLLLELKGKFELTYLFISHDLNLVSYLSDYMAIMYRGKIVESGSVEAVAAGPLHPYTNKLFASVPGFNETPLSAQSREEEFYLDSRDYAAGLPAGYGYQMPGKTIAQSADEHSDQERAGRVLLEVGPDHFVCCYPRNED